MSSVEQSRSFLQHSLQDGQVRIPASHLLNFVGKLHAESLPPVDYFITEQTLVGQALGDFIQWQINLVVQVFKPKTSLSIPLFNNSMTVTQFADDSGAAQLGLVGTHQTLFVSDARTYNVSITALSAFSSDKKSGCNVNIPRASRTKLTMTVNVPHLAFNVSSCADSETKSTESQTSVICHLAPTTHVGIQWTEKRATEVTEEDLPVKREPMVVTATQNTLYSIGESVCSSNTTWEYRILHDTKSDFSLKFDPRVRVLSVMGKEIKRWDVQRALPSSQQTTRTSILAPTQTLPAPTDGLTTATVVLLAGDGTQPVLASPVVDGVEVSGAGTLALTHLDQPQTLRIYLNRAVEGAYEIHVTTEMDMDGTSCQVNLPVFSCDGVNKEIGYLGVEARTNVEINELQARGVAKVDVRELPAYVTGKASQALIYAYKFLQPRLKIHLDVKKHEDVSVLIAVVDQGWLEFVVSDDRVLTRCVLKVRNTQRQYMRVQLPKGSNVWSLVVNGNAAKPSQDVDGKYLIPLEKSGGTTQQSFWVEFVYLEMDKPKMGRQGSVNLSIPVFDMPINHLFVCTYLPKLYSWGKFVSDLQKVKYFSVQVPTELYHGTFISAQPKVLAVGGRLPQRSQVQVQVQPQSRLTSNVMYSARSQVAYDAPQFLNEESADEDDDDDERGGEVLYLEERRPMAIPQKPRSQRGGRERAHSVSSREELQFVSKESNSKSMGFSRGVIPVMVQVPRLGEEFRFERLLVIEQGFNISIDYKRRTKGCFDVEFADD